MPKVQGEEPVSDMKTRLKPTQEDTSMRAVIRVPWRIACVAIPQHESRSRCLSSVRPEASLQTETQKSYKKCATCGEGGGWGTSRQRDALPKVHGRDEEDAEAGLCISYQVAHSTKPHRSPLNAFWCVRGTGCRQGLARHSCCVGPCDGTRPGEPGLRLASGSGGPGDPTAESPS